jgi:hydrogenase-4 component B
MTPTIIGLYCIAVLLGASGLGVLARHQKFGSALVYGLCLAAALAALGAALQQLLGSQPPVETVLPVGLPWLGAHFRMDALSAAFLVIVSLGSAAASLYALGYGRHEKAPSRVLPFYPAFLAGMNLVVLAHDAFTFLLSWEFMSLASWALVISHGREQDNVRAAYTYLLMACFGTLSLLLAFGLLAGPDGGYGFAAIREHRFSAELASVVLILALIGAGSKAGLVPLHIWLPLAHPAAPSHVSALMSGVMTKVAVYGFIRIAFDLLGPPVWWWSIVVLVFGGGTAVLGVLYALMQHDLKRLLAYHTVENIGIIFIGLGLALAFRSSGAAAPAALALTGALFHVFNHSVFKSLLFFGAGAVQNATNERDMERLGGLIRPMPYTAFTFLVGCAAISALPPLNGFVSEWLTFQAILLSPQLPQWGLKLVAPAIGAMLALSAALAAACFVKAFGVTFLGQPRTGAVEQAKETDRWSLTAMFALSLLCLLAGTAPGTVMDSLASVTQLLVGGRTPAQGGLHWLTIAPVQESRSSYNGMLVFLFITLAALTAAAAIHRLASRVVRRGPAWDCGFPFQTAQMQYTASSFAQPIRRVFGTFFFQARESVDMPAPGDPRPARFTVELHDLVWEKLYTPLVRMVEFSADKLNRLQFLSIRRYLSLVFFALVSLLLVLAIWL